MEGHLRGDAVEVGGNARERYYDSSGYGRPDGDGVVLSVVEAAHLLYRGDLAAVDGRGFGAFLADNADRVVPFLVYRDLRERGFYVTPARGDRVEAPADVDFVVHPRGDGPWDGSVAYRVRVVDERADVALADLGDVVVAVVDEESEITYLETERLEPKGATTLDVEKRADGVLLDDRVLCPDPPSVLYERGFYGQRMDDAGETLQLSLLEATHLAADEDLKIDGGADEIRARGREVEGDRFDRRLAVYRALRERGVVPKTGFKFGADFRTYADVEHVEELGHSELLVRVLPWSSVRSPREVALDVRLAHGVRKRMVFALVDGDDIGWVSVSRLTP
ncbi:tRNA-intron lyase [Halobacteriales archaeon SW_12_69_24]|nr:MAG: tRNA-intron lyase [Halobacteriales archaeon SW_12_69_24]